MAFRDYCSELVGTIPRLPYPLAQKLVNRSWREICDARLWSFLVGNADIVSAQNVTTGTVSTTLGSTTVTLDADAAAALAPFALANPPLAHPSLGQGRLIRIGLTGSGGPLYSIVAADFDANPAILTLDRVYANPSGAGQPYQVYKAYFAPPDTDFLRYFTVTNMRAGYTIRGRKLYLTQQRLNALDSQRSSIGDAYNVASYKSDAAGRPVHEWYPHPVNASVYNCLYQKRGQPLSNTIDLPATMTDTVLLDRAMMHAADWALANVSNYPELQQTNWVMFKEGKRKDFKDALLQAIKQDDEISPLGPFIQGSQFDFPLGGAFLQGHDVSRLMGE